MASNIQDTLSSEQRVVRQQVFAAIRKMDAGELSASQFKDRMMQIGIELPPDIFKLLIDHQSSGAATFNTFASAFESCWKSVTQAPEHASVL